MESVIDHAVAIALGVGALLAAVAGGYKGYDKLRQNASRECMVELKRVRQQRDEAREDLAEVKARLAVYEATCGE